MFTVVSIILAIFFAFFKEQSPPSEIAAVIMTLLGAILLCLSGLAVILSYIPLQAAQQHISPRLFSIYRKDNLLFYAFIGVLGFAFASIILAIVRPSYTLSLWLIAMGVAFDLFTMLIRRTLYFLNPFQVVKIFTHDARKSIENNKEMDLCDNIDSLSEMAIVSINRNNTSLSNEAVSEIRHIGQIFLESYKSIGHVEGSEELKKLGIKDTVEFIIFYILQRFEMIFDNSLEKRFETVCSAIITALGQTTIAAAKYDITMTAYPLHFLRRLALKAQEKGFQEIGVKASLTIQEIAKSIIGDMDVSYMELQPPFLSMINTLDELAKEAFRKDKKLNIQVLIHPFIVLKELFSSKKMEKHQDTPLLIQNIDRVISEFETLQAVLMAMPPMPNILPEEEEPFAQKDKAP